MTTTTEAPVKARRPKAHYQPHLVPPVPPIYKFATIPLDTLAPNALLRGEPPDNDIVESVRMLGFVDPITVRPADDPSFDYVVDDGGRRVKAARSIVEELTRAGQDIPAHLRDVPAIIVLNVGDVGAAAIALQKHSTRRRNKVGEYERLKSLVNAGATEAELRAETRLTRGQIRELLALDALRPDLLAAAGESRISWGQAHDLARLPDAAQARLAAVLAETGRIRQDEIQREREVRRETATDAIDWGAINATPSTTGAARDLAALVDKLRIEVARLQAELDEAQATTASSDRLGAVIAEAVGQLDDVRYKAEAVVSYNGREYWVRVSTRSPLGGDSDGRAIETPRNGTDVAEAAQEAPAAARTRPERIKPCEHGADPETCDDLKCRTRRSDRKRKRTTRGIAA